MIEDCTVQGHTGMQIELELEEGSMIKNSRIICEDGMAGYDGKGYSPSEPRGWFAISFMLIAPRTEQIFSNFSIINSHLAGAKEGIRISRWTTGKKDVYIQDTVIKGGLYDIFAQPTAKLMLRIKNCKFENDCIRGVFEGEPGVAGWGHGISDL